MSFKISVMQASDVQLALEWARLEQWNPGNDDNLLLFQIDPSGWLVGKLDGEPVVVISAFNWDDNYAQIGCYITKPKFRSQGFGRKIFNEALRHVGNRITGLFALDEMVEKYSQEGFQPQHSQLIFYSLDNARKFAFRDDSLVDVEKVAFDQLVTFDRRFFPADRKKFLQAIWMTSPGRIGLASVVNGRLRGYGVMRKCGEKDFRIGPLYAEDFDIAEMLVRAFCALSGDGLLLFISPVGGNHNAKRLEQTFELSQKLVCETMYRNGVPDYDVTGVYSTGVYVL